MVTEIWWSCNPRFASEPVDRMFRSPDTRPPGTVLVEVQWSDNPWFPEVLRRDLQYDRVRDPDVAPGWSSAVDCDLHRPRRIMLAKWANTLV